jgi:hypothetical protein
MRQLSVAVRHAGAVKIACVLCAVITVATPAYGQIPVWNNSLENNNFGDADNWTNWPGSFNPGANQVWTINLTGANRAELNSAIGNVRRDVLVGDGGGQGELVIQSGGSMTVTRNMRLGRGGTDVGFGIVTVSGGSLSITSNLFAGQSDRSENVFTLNSGTVSVTVDAAVASAGDSQGTLTISGGVFNVGGNALFSDGGSLPSTSVLNLSGNAALNVTGNFSPSSGNGGGTTTATIKDNATLTATNLRVGFGTNGTTTLNIEGGTINATTGFTTFGQAAGSTVNVAMSGGTINSDRINWANNASGTATLTMTGGTMNIVRSGSSEADITGAFVMSLGDSQLDIGGSALVNAEKLYITAGGVLELAGNSLMNITGATDGKVTFDFVNAFESGDWSGVLGKINFSSLDTMLQVAGASQDVTVPEPPAPFTYNFADLFNAAIDNNVFTKSVGTWPGYQFQVAYDPVTDFTTVQVVVPEPSAFALGLGGVALLGFAARARRRRG